jgi:diguanylate cyclase (GGDEF)-like protein
VANHTSVALRNGELVNRLRHDSMHDALTGLPNRASLERDLDALYVTQGDDVGFALAMLDVDTFKEVNDTLGHHFGDALLCEVATRLTFGVGPRGRVFRFGGDEFAILLPGCADVAAADAVCRQVLRDLTHPVELAGTAIDLGASVGIALAPSHGRTTGDLVKRADLAMYAAKQSGRDITLYEAAHDTSSPARLALVASLRHAVGSADIDVFVQPKADLATGKVTGVEALARWTDSERGSVPPDEFIALAERSGLILQLTDVVLERAISACADWQSEAPGVGIAVNLSARSLRDDKLDEQIGRLLRRYDLPGELLTLEITESSVMADPEGSLGLLHRIRRRGIRLSIDDFGTGYSSLSYLRRLPVQEVKIDRSFVSGMDHDAENQAIVASILQLAKALDLSVVAEGVEETAEWRMLETLGCDSAQGYLLARPMTVAEFPEWLRQRESGVPRLHVAR